ncbi:MAG: hypothetical protein UT33_C0008G0040 [Candidatus Peregrinibacteria bacterium GW2011_GWC2_39_14]|nr:MAG: hypothetical protein US92_C0004G0040 [Candidatus Peregrinibacteria bacterium GW2011_GWA2_38_36]KKR06724.1 MAG: hypothetical protein UT33_C0008G0040 [Candidatus Peregrinibacteria bacterium GW2011_GWC2_39_14]
MANLSQPGSASDDLGDEAESISIHDLDLRIDDAVMQKFRAMARENSANIAESNLYIEQRQAFWASLPDDGVGEEVSVAQYIEMNPHLLRAYDNMISSVQVRANAGLLFSQKVRKNSTKEAEFIAQVRRICEGGEFVEVFVIIAVLDDGAQIKKFAFSAIDWVKEEDINLAVVDLKKELGQRKPIKMFSLHNHPDQLAKSKIKSVHPGPEIGFISTNSLTVEDINEADRMHHEFFPGVPLLEIAVSESGLTYEYEVSVQD